MSTSTFSVVYFDIDVIKRSPSRDKSSFWHSGAETGVFAVFNAAQYPRIATSTVAKTTDRDNPLLKLGAGYVNDLTCQNRGVQK
jgi:hypothetical protein